MCLVILPPKHGREFQHKDVKLLIDAVGDLDAKFFFVVTWGGGILLAGHTRFS
jgi:hypothetical protein